MRKTFFTLLLVVVLPIAFVLITKRTRAAAPMSRATIPATPAAAPRSLSTLLNPDGTPNLSPYTQGSFDATGFRMELTPSGAPRFVAQAACGMPAMEGWDTQHGSNAMTGEVLAIAISGNDVYIGGTFTSIGNLAVNRIAKWNGSTWSALSGGGGNGVSGTNFSSVSAIAISGGNIYVGGSFSQANAGGTVVPTNNLAKWNGSMWSALSGGDGNGVNNTVNAIAVSGSNVYVGGRFTQANVGGTVITANAIAKWDGNTWSALGSGGGNGFSNASVSAIAISGSDIYVGGSFSQANAGGTVVAANNLAKWNGSNWSAIGVGSGNGVNGSVSALATSGSDLYIGGGFTQANGGGTVVAANGIVRWNGSVWGTLGSGGGNGISDTFTGGSVLDIAIIGSDVYVSGSFARANVGGTVVNVNSFARWNGTSWTAVGSGGGNGVNGIRSSQIQPISALAVSGSDLYVGGNFTQANIGGTVVDANKIAKWNGSAWSELPANGSGNGANHAVYAVTVSGNDVYVGGEFTTIGNIRANHIAKWNGNIWSVLGTNSDVRSNGVDGGVYAIAVNGNDVYVGGKFTQAFSGGTGISTTNIAKWNGSTWSVLGSNGGTGVDGFVGLGAVYAIAVNGTDVYVGGSFTLANVGGGTFTANRIAKWNGSAWSALGTGSGNGFDRPVMAIAVSGSNVYVGGGFTQANVGGTTVTANRIVKWDGSNWTPLGSGGGNGVDGFYVLSIAIGGNDVYVGGNMRTANIGGTTVGATGIAKWNGSTWSSIGSAVNTTGTISFARPDFFFTAVTNGVVSSIHLQGSDAYVGGSFTSIGGVAANSVAKWNGSSWSALGSGIEHKANEWVYALGAVGNNVYAGGDFAVAGGNFSTNFARYQTATPTVTTLTGPAVATTYGQAASFTASVTSGGTPLTTGCVTFKEGATVLVANVPLNSNGQAAFNLSTLSAGAHTITAEYNGSGNYGLSTGTANHSVNKATLTITADNQSKVFGAPLPALTSTITGFVNNETAGVLSGTPALVTTATASSPVNTYPITVTQGTLTGVNYDFSFVNGTLTVTKANSTVALNSSANPSDPGQAVTLTATITPATATGNVEFFRDATSLGSGVISNGMATITTTALPAGLSTLRAVYAGDGNHNGSQSANLAQTVLNTSAGNNVIVNVGDLTLTFATISQKGQTTVTPISPEAVGTLPAQYQLTTGQQAWEITTTAIFSGPITITFKVTNVEEEAAFARLRVFHGENGLLVDRTILVPDAPAPDFNAKEISARVTSLSPFVLAIGAGGIAPNVGSAKAGSVLVFPYYTSNAATKSDTHISLSNISDTVNAPNANLSYVHVFFIDGASCQQSDLFVCLTPNASFSFKASEFDPETTGWLLAVAIDGNGNPIRNNVLIGNAFVRDRDYVGNYGAESFWANSAAPATLEGNKATLNFNATDYDQVATQLVAEIQSPADATNQRLITVGLQGDLLEGKVEGAAQVGVGTVYNGDEKPSSFSALMQGTCHARAILSTTNPRIPNGMTTLIPSGQVGTIKFNVGAGVGLLMTPHTARWKGIRTLHKTALTTSTLTIPVITPVC